MKNIQFVLDDPDYYMIQEVKNRSGLSWSVFVVKAAEAYAEKLIEEGE